MAWGFSGKARLAAHRATARRATMLSQSHKVFAFYLM